MVHEIDICKVNYPLLRFVIIFLKKGRSSRSGIRQFVTRSRLHFLQGINKYAISQLLIEILAAHCMVNVLLTRSWYKKLLMSWFMSVCLPCHSWTSYKYICAIWSLIHSFMGCGQFLNCLMSMIIGYVMIIKVLSPCYELLQFESLLTVM